MSNKWVKRISRALLPCFVFFVFSFSFAPKAYAITYEGPWTYGGVLWYDASTSQVFTNNGNLPLINVSSPAIARSQGAFYTIRLNSDPTVEFTGSVKLYASFYPVLMSGGSPSTNTMVANANVTNRGQYVVDYINHLGQTGTVAGGLDKVTSLNNTASAVGKTYSIEASWVGSEGQPVRALRIIPNITAGFQVTAASGNNRSYNITYPSIRVVTSTTTAETEALDNVAESIIAQNDILLAMKGDIVAILQDIYQMTGDINTAQNLLNSYVEQMVPLLKNVRDGVVNVYNLLGTQLRLLETAIENAADSIEAAIAAQTSAMIAYLEQYFNTGNEVPDETYQQQQDAQNILDQMGSLEKPDVNTIVPVIDDYSDSGVSGVLGAIFSSNLIVTMMTLSASFAFGAYVLFGKRD